MQEIWRDIEGFSGEYQVSNLGRIKSNKGYANIKERILKQSPSTKGYLQVCLRYNSKQKTYRVHRLVAQTFLPNPENLPQVNHKDEDKTNNCVTNLEWCNNQYNSVYNNKHWRKGKLFKCIETNVIYHSTRECSNKLNIDRRSIMRHLKGVYGYSCLNNLHFEYI